MLQTLSRNYQEKYMGWFDKKSWQLRQKIKDLQTELAFAEREGKYVVEQGLFFAELDEMGDATLMLLGKADHLEADEEPVVRTFFDRNGFTVERLKLDRSQKALADVEIIPPEELTRHVARILKNSGYRMVDDSEHERPADLDNKIFPLSAVVRSISALFAEHVHHIIVTTGIKMNMEGNRLLHWLPLIHDALIHKIGPDAPEVARDSFFDGYNHYYARFGHLEQDVTPTGRRLNLDEAQPITFDDEPSLVSGFTTGPATAVIHDMHVPAHSEAASALAETPQEFSPAGIRSATVESPWNRPAASVPPEESGSKHLSSAEEQVENASPSDLRRALDVALCMTEIYKSLIGASPKRHVRNAKLVLEEFAKLFSADCACLLLPPEDGIPEFEQAISTGQKVCATGSSDSTIKASSQLVHRCLSEKSEVIQAMEASMDPSESMISQGIETGMAAPVIINNKIRAIVYLDRRTSLQPFTLKDAKHLMALIEAFREFPDLLIRPAGHH